MMWRLPALTLLCLSLYPAGAEVIYVDADAPTGGNGESWPSAYDNLQDALRSARPGDEIWVAEALYYPTDGRNRSKSFRLRDGVAVYGGFLGIETNRNERDWLANVSVLSGNIGDPQIEYDNTFRIITSEGLGEKTVIDGFTVTHAHNDREGILGRGGAMYNESSSPIIANCSFIDNYALGGAGLWNERSNPTVRSCLFRLNERTAVFNNSSSPAYFECLFEKNKSIRGAGMASDGMSSPLVVGCEFRRNDVSSVGGAYFGWGDPVFVNCTFSRNKAGVFGGAMYLRGLTSTLTNCTIYGNRAKQDGGGIVTHSETSRVILINCIAWGNRGLPQFIEENQIGTGVRTINYCCIEGWTGKHGGVGNHGEDPLFLDPDKDNLRLRSGSPCIDKGDNEAVTEPKDLDGNPRILHQTVDMGVYESVCDDLSGLELTCSDTGKLKAKLTTALPKGSTVTLTNSTAKKAKQVAINRKGVGKAKWRNQTGQIEICPAGCDGPCQRVQCP